MNFFQPKNFKFFGSLLCALALSSCALPGSSYRSPAASNEDNYDNISEQVNLYKITPQVLYSLNAQQQSAPSLSPKAKSYTTYDYKIGIGDVLNIIVWEHPELSIPQGPQRGAAESGNLVHADGTIFYPYVGKLSVAGKSVIQVRQQLAKRLQRFIRSPQIDVAVAAYRSQNIHVTGAVKNPGQIGINNVPLTLLNALHKAGGLDSISDWENVTVVRNGVSHIYSARALLVDGDITQDIVLKDGDIVHVPTLAESKAYVLGEVKKPISIQFGHNRISLIDAITSSGGLNNDNAQTSGVFVFRPGSNNKSNVFQLDASDAAAYLLAERFTLKPKDIVFVTTAPISRWNRLISQILPTVGLYRLFAGADFNLINK